MDPAAAEGDVAGFPVQPAATEQQGGVGGQALGLVDGDRVAVVEAAGGQVRRAEAQLAGRGADVEAAGGGVDGDARCRSAR